MSETSILAALQRLIAAGAVERRGVWHVGRSGGALAEAYRGLGFAESGAGAGNVLVAEAPRGLPLAAAGTLDGAVIDDPPRGRRLAALDRALFDAGLVRLSGEAGPAIYLRSSLVCDPRATGGRADAAVAMSHLGHNAGFANQLFQYAFLKLYALRHNCRIEAPRWIGETVYGLPASPITKRRREWRGDDFSVRDLALWNAVRPPVDVDFFGYFQNVPPCWQRHRAFLRRLFTPAEPWRAPIEDWLARNRPPDATLVAIHLRRGDYARYEAEKPWFRTIPAAWYRAWLERLWPTLQRPMLYVATDDRAVLGEFAAYSPLTAATLEARLPDATQLADFEIMARADVLAICNSSFSRMAALVAPGTQRCFLPAPDAAAFEPYQPWQWDEFWQRFGAPDGRARRRSLLPRWLRRRA